MKLSEIQKKAKKVGIKEPQRYSKRDMIRAIQRAEGNFDCFGTAINSCDQMVCCWRSDCLR